MAASTHCACCHSAMPTPTDPLYQAVIAGNLDLIRRVQSSVEGRFLELADAAPKEARIPVLQALKEKGLDPLESLPQEEGAPADGNPVPALLMVINTLAASILSDVLTVFPEALQKMDIQSRILCIKEAAVNIDLIQEGQEQIEEDPQTVARRVATLRALIEHGADPLTFCNPENEVTLAQYLANITKSDKVKDILLDREPRRERA